MAVQMTENVETSALDQNHILSTIGPSNFGGVAQPLTPSDFPLNFSS